MTQILWLIILTVGAFTLLNLMTQYPAYTVRPEQQLAERLHLVTT